MSDLPPPPPPPPPDYGPSPGHGPAPYAAKAGPWIRFLAHLIDGLVLLIPSILISVLIAGTGSTYGRFDYDVADFIAAVLTTLLSLGYAVWLESSRGQTLGKMALSLHVQGPNGGYPTPSEAFRRNAYVLLSLVPIVGGLASLGIVIAIAVTISNDLYGRGLHDNFAGGTIVQRVR